MEITAAGFLILPLTAIFLFRPGALLRLTLLSAALGGASPAIVNLGGSPFGLAVGFAPGLAFIGMFAYQRLFRNSTPEERIAAYAVAPMLLFVAAAVAGAFVLPRLFAGMFDVWPQKPDVFNIAEPLQPNSGNVTQTLYIVVNIAMLFTAALCASDGRTRPTLFVRAYLASGFVVAALCYWQFASNLTGLYYPEEFLHSNPRWTTLSSQSLGAVTRINGPFTEPAALAAYLSGMIFTCLWMLLRGTAGAGVRLLLLMSAGAMLLSTSTTGIIILTVFVPAVLLRSATTRELRVIGLGVIGVIAGLLTLFFVASIAMPAVVASIEAQADVIIESTLNKGDSDSGMDRTAKDLSAVSVLVPSIGFGAGWGSVRSSSLIPGILGNAGLPGLVLLAWCGARITRLVRRARRLAPAGEDRAAMDAMTGSVLGTLCAGILSAPTIDAIDFFVRIAVMVGCAARICTTAHAQNASVANPPSFPLAAAAPGSPS
jgi:hypothetical protein